MPASRLLPLVALLASAMPAAPGSPVLFDRDVMAVLSRTGCNAETCHGNLNGKGGLKLLLCG